MLLFFSILFHLIASAQNNIPGQYHSNKRLIDTASSRETLNLNCNKTFTITDSNNTSFGKWYRKNRNILILQTDSAIYQFKTFHKKWEFELTIKNNELFEKGLTRHEYWKLYRWMEKSTGEGQDEESYSEYKNNKNRHIYYFKVDSYECNR